jgi:hypothetical protein
MKRLLLTGCITFCFSLFLIGCGEKDTGDRRIDMRLWNYNPAQPDAYLDVMKDNEINVFAEEHWDGFFSDSYNSVEDAVVTFNADRVPFLAAIRGYSDINLPFAPGEVFSLDLVLNGTETFTFSDSIPDIDVHGLPSVRDTVLTPDETLLIRWTEVPGTVAQLYVMRDELTIDTFSNRRGINWSPENSYRGERIHLEFRWTYSFPSDDPFNVMQYEYVASHFVDVE